MLWTPEGWIKHLEAYPMTRAGFASVIIMLSSTFVAYGSGGAELPCSERSTPNWEEVNRRELDAKISLLLDTRTDGEVAQLCMSVPAVSSGVFRLDERRTVVALEVLSVTGNSVETGAFAKMFSELKAPLGKWRITEDPVQVINLAGLEEVTSVSNLANHIASGILSRSAENVTYRIGVK